MATVLPQRTILLSTQAPRLLSQRLDGGTISNRVSKVNYMMNADILHLVANIGLFHPLLDVQNMCIWICTYIYIYIFIFISIFLFTCVYIYIFIHIYIYIYIYISYKLYINSSCLVSPKISTPSGLQRSQSRLPGPLRASLKLCQFAIRVVGKRWRMASGKQAFKPGRVRNAQIAKLVQTTGAFQSHEDTPKWMIYKFRRETIRNIR